MKNSSLFLILFACITIGYAQENKIDYTSDRTITDEDKYPGALLFSKVDNQVFFTHEGINVWCDQAIFYEKDQFFKALGNVKMKQGDSITLTSKYAEYDGETQFAFASNQVNLKTKTSRLTTDTLFFKRDVQQVFYRSGGTVRDSGTTITSKVGRYFLEQEKLSFLHDVLVNHPEYTINSSQLNYFTQSKHAYLYGPSTITGKETQIYCERGFYDTQRDEGYFVKNSTVNYKNRKLEGDSIYFNRSKNFASATNNIRVTDTINHSILTGHYAEVYREKDSVFITKRALGAIKQENDTLFVHSDTLMITGPTKQRLIRGFRDTRFYKKDMNGKCDSIVVNEQLGISKLLGKPVVFSGENQLTGDTIHLLNHPKTNKLDSLKVFYNAFMIQKDSLGGFNQVKGKEMFGLFEKDELKEINFIKNTETIFYSRDDKQQLIGINTVISSSIKIEFEDQEIAKIYYYKNPKQILYREEDLPKNARKLKGFNWRGNERLESKNDLFRGKPTPTLTKIEGIPLPSNEEPNFFNKGKDTDKQEKIHESSRLNKELLTPREEDQMIYETEPEEN